MTVGIVERWYLVDTRNNILDWDNNEAVVEDAVASYTKHIERTGESARGGGLPGPGGHWYRNELKLEDRTIVLPLRVEKGRHGDFVLDQVWFLEEYDMNLMRQAKDMLCGLVPDGEGLEDDDKEDFTSLVSRLSVRIAEHEGK
jgi:hypothetical protein